MLKYLALDFLNKFSEIVGRYYNHEMYKEYLGKSLNLFQQIVQSKKIIDNDRYIIYLSAGICYYFLQKMNLTNISMKEIVNIYHIKNKHIQEYYDIIKNLE